jgi:hypothetical protein
MERAVSIDSGKTHLTEIDLGALVLQGGSHEDRRAGVCLMEAVAWFAGLPHSDRPPCVSPVLGSFARTMNDRMNEQDRQQLKRFIPVLPGTAGSPADDRARAWLAVDWLVHTRLVAWLDAAGLADDATAVQELDPVLNYEALEDAAPVLRRARTSAGAAYTTAWATLRETAAADAAVADADADDAAAAAVWATLRETAAAVAAAAVADVADAAAAAVAAAAAAAAAATRARVREAAREAARARLQPVVSRLQASALDLFGRMIETKHVV